MPSLHLLLLFCSKHVILVAQGTGPLFLVKLLLAIYRLPDTVHPVEKLSSAGSVHPGGVCVTLRRCRAPCECKLLCCSYNCAEWIEFTPSSRILLLVSLFGDLWDYGDLLSGVSQWSVQSDKQWLKPTFDDYLTILKGEYCQRPSSKSVIFSISWLLMCLCKGQHWQWGPAYRQRTSCVFVEFFLCVHIVSVFF